MPARAVNPVPPMMATPVKELPVGPEWSYEVKWDGYRAEVVKDRASVWLASRNLKNITAQFPTVASAAARLNAKQAVIDGEIVAVDRHGRPSFQALHHSATSGVSLVFYAFDLLHLDGKDLMRMPLDDRRAALGPAISASGLLLSEPLPGTPRQIERVVRRLNLEGVVAKQRHSFYQPGKRSRAWVKVRFSLRQEFVIGGYKPNAVNFDSILVGYYDDGKLMYAGKVRSGFTPHSRAEVFARIAPLEIKRCPFANLPTSRSSHWGEGITAEEMTLLRWVKPVVVVEVAFTEWTRDGGLRHAAFVALRDDKNPFDVRRE